MTDVSQAEHEKLEDMFHFAIGLIYGYSGDRFDSFKAVEEHIKDHYIKHQKDRIK